MNNNDDNSNNINNDNNEVDEYSIKITMSSCLEICVMSHKNVQFVFF